MKMKYSYVDGGVHAAAGRILYRRAEASGGADSGRYNHYVSGALGAVAQWEGDCDRLLSKIEEVEGGGKDYVVDNSNDVTMTFDRSGVQIDIEVNDDWVGKPDGRFTLAEVKSIVREWKRFLALPKSLDTVVEFTI